jgi:putative DNA primase/helicase
MNSPIEQFREAMAAAGLRTGDDIVDDGQIHRFHVDGDKPRSKNGWYVLHGDGIPAGQFGSWKHDVSTTWCAKSDKEFTPEERRAYAQRMDAIKQQREAEQERMRAEARAKAARIWAEAEPANDDHPYLMRKQVRSFGLRESRGSLVIPVLSPDGVMQSLQFIDIEGNKLFLKGGMKRGCYYKIGGKPTDRVIVVEGYATGATVHEAQGCPVAVVFDAGNIEPVADMLRKRLPPDIQVEVWADNDNEQTCRECGALFDVNNHPMVCPHCGGNHGRKNTGLMAANKAAAKIGATVVAPKSGDFNDLAVEQGIEAVTAITVAANDNRQMDMSPLPYVGGRGKPLSTIENLHEICRRLGVIIRYDVIRKDDEILIPGVSFSVDNKANASLAWLASQCAKFNYPTGQIGDFVTFLADQNLYNPAINYVTSKPWDGVSRAKAFYNTVTAKGGDQSLKETLMKRWMISAIAAAFRPDGVSAHGVLVLQGDQYLGKTKWFKSLVPDHTRLAQDGWILRPDDKDSVKQACSFWLVELGELDATFRKSDIAALKSFLTRDRDVLRRAYAKRESEYGRRTVFFASVNPREFLHDITGNRRYWTIECEHIDHSHNLDMQQVWAEFHHMYAQGETWFLQPDEMAKLNEANTEFEVRDPIEDRLMSRLDWQAPNAIWRWMTVLDVLIEVGIERPERNQLNTAGHIIRKLNNGAAKKTHGVRRVLVPPKHGEQDQPF